MKCNCRTEIEAKIAENFKQQTPTGEQHKVELQGHGFTMASNKMEEIAYMPYETLALMPLKSGALKPKRTTGHMLFTYCPFCGAKATGETK